MSRAGCWITAAVLAAGAVAPGRARAEVPVVQQKRARDIVVEIPGERTRTNQIVLGSLLGSGVVIGALGLYFNLDARSAKQDVDARIFTGRVWTQREVDLVARADRSSTRAAIAYGIGGALVAASAIAFILTDPKSETSVIRTTRPAPVLAPSTSGGAILGGAWRF